MFVTDSSRECMCVQAHVYHFYSSWRQWICWLVLESAFIPFLHLLFFLLPFSHVWATQREDHWSGMCVSFSTCANMCETERLKARRCKYFHPWLFTWHSAWANKAVMHAVVCVSVRGYLSCFVLTRESQFLLKSFPPSLLLQSHFDTRRQCCQQIRFLLYIFVSGPAYCNGPSYWNFCTLHLTCFFFSPAVLARCQFTTKL